MTLAEITVVRNSDGKERAHVTIADAALLMSHSTTAARGDKAAIERMLQQ
jgi:hypothetical protein